jgi:hypothetical protein
MGFGYSPEAAGCEDSKCAHVKSVASRGLAATFFVTPLSIEPSLGPLSGDAELVDPKKR